VPLIVGMGKAAQLARKNLPEYEKKARPLRDELEEGTLSSRPIYPRCCAQAVVNGTAEHGWGRRTADLKNTRYAG